MGIAGSPYIFQANTSELIVALEFVRTYLDNLLCITKASLDDYLDHLRLVLTRLREVGLKINAPKLKFCAEETEYLGYILTRKNYQDLWARHSEMLAGHTKVTRAKKTKKKAWHWDEVHQIAFDNVKATIARDIVLAYPDYSKEFEIYTDASS